MINAPTQFRTLFALLFSLQLMTLCSAQQDPEILLEQIKQILLSESIESGVSVISSGYVDSSGKLIESAFYSSEADVAGVRVLEYLPQDYRTQMAADLSGLPANIRGFIENGCAHAQEEITTNASLLISQNTKHLSRISDAIEDIFLKKSELPWITSTDHSRNAQTTYERAYLGRTANHNVDYQINISLRENESEIGKSWLAMSVENLQQATGNLAIRFSEMNPIQEKIPKPSGNSYSFTIKIEFVNLSYPNLSSVNEYNFIIKHSGDKLANVNIDNQVVNQIAKITDEWSEVMQLSSCYYKLLKVRHTQREQEFAMNVGSKNGVELGDKFLIMNDRIMRANQVLNSDLLSSLAIAEIVSISEDSAELSLVTRSAVNLPINIVALPF
jgi:hypothetical protein